MVFAIWVLFSLGNIVFFLSGKTKEKTRKQIMCVLLALLIFSLAAAFRCLTVSIISSVILLFALIYGIRKNNLRMPFDKQRLCVFGIIAAAFIGLSVSQIFITPLWDASLYSDSINSIAARFDYGLTTSVKDYYLCDHISLGYTFVWLIGTFLAPGGVGPHLSQVIFGALSVCAAYETFFCLKTKCTEKEVKRYDPLVLALTCLYAFSPALLGLAGDLSVDYGMLCFLPFVMLALIKGWDYLAVLAGAAFCMTKEPAIMLYGGLAAGIILFEFRQKNYKKWICLLLPLVLWGIVFLRNGMYFSGGTPGEFDGIGLNLEFVKFKLKQIVFMNFNWLLILITVVLGVILIRQRKKAGDDDSGKSFLLKYAGSLSLGFLAFTVLGCAFVTYTQYRYILAYSYYFAFMIAALLFAVSAKKVVKLGLAALLSVILLGQTFMDLDVLSGATFHKLVIAEDGASLIANSLPDDGAIYNRKYCGYTKLLEKALFTAGVDDQSIILRPAACTDWGLTGARYEWRLNYKEKRFARNDEEVDDVIGYYNSRMKSVDTLDTLNLEGKKIICIDFPWVGYQTEDKIRGKLDITESYVIKEGPWEAKVFVATMDHPDQVR